MFFTLFYREGEYRILCWITLMVLCWSSPSCFSHQTMMCARGYLYLEVLNYEVPLVMSPVVQAMGQAVSAQLDLAPLGRMRARCATTVPGSRQCRFLWESRSCSSPGSSSSDFLFC